MGDHTILLMVRVQSTADELLSHAKVLLHESGAPPPSAVLAAVLAYDPQSSAFVWSPALTGDYLLRVVCDGFDDQERRITVTHGRNEEIVILGAPGSLFYFRGKVRVPFEPHTNLIGVKLKGREIERDLADVVKRLNLQEYTDIPEQARADGGRVFATEPARVRDVLSELMQLASVSRAGAIVGLRERSIAFLTNE